MRYNDLPEQCKTCKNLKVWALDMGGNHGVACKKGSWNLEKEESFSRIANSICYPKYDTEEEAEAEEDNEG